MALNIVPTTRHFSTIGSSYFGANSLFQIDDIPDGQFTGNVTYFGISNVRWPGGSITEAWFDPANPDVPLAVPRRTGQALDPNEIMTFTEITNWAKSTSHSLSVVLPTIHILKPADANGNRAVDWGAVADIKGFVKAALSAGGTYADATIASFEIGNEYWSKLTSKEYGRIANVLVKAVQEGIDESGAAYDPKILVQVGDEWGPDFKPGGEHYGKGLTWGEILEVANQDILSRLDPTARGIIDGLIDHFYPKLDSELGYNSASVWGVEKRQSVWADNGMDLPLHLTEWNANMSGVPAGTPVFAMGSGLVESFEMLARIGVASAFVWPVNQKTSNDLGGEDGSGPGHLSASGAAFKLLSENVRGLTLGELTIEDSPSFETSLYNSPTKAVLFISRDDGSAYSGAVDLSGISPSNPGNGFYLRIVEKKIVRDLSEDAYVGSGSGAAIVLDEEGRVADLPSWALNLQPYEISMITVEWVAPNIISSGAASIRGTTDNDRITGTAASQSISAWGGNDTITGGGGKDTLDGGGGNDSIVAGGSDDLLYGWNGADTLSGGGGADSLNGHDGNDIMYGGDGNDVLSGSGMTPGGVAVDDGGEDTLVGGYGDDDLVGGSGADTLYFGTGAISGGGNGIDNAYGGPGADQFVFGGSSGWTGIRDFQDGLDKIRFTRPGVDSVSDLTFIQRSETDGRKYVLVKYSDDLGGGDIRVETQSGDILVSQLTSADFIF